jgi:hypothetical protein
MWDQGHSCPLQLITAYIADTDKLAAGDSKGFDFHLAPSLGAARSLISEVRHHAYSPWRAEYFSN